MATLAGCGSSAAATPASTADAVSTESAAAADTDLAYIQGKGKMTIGYTVYEPMNYTDADGNFTGFDTELATAVCAKLGVEPDFVEINWDTKVVELDAKSIDCIWNGMTLTDDIMANTACTKAYAKNAQVVVMKADADYSSTADLVGRAVYIGLGMLGALFGLIAAFVKLPKCKVFGAIALVLAVAGNVVGLIRTYSEQQLPMIALIVLAVAAVLFAVVAIVNAKKKAKAPAETDEDIYEKA